MKNKRNHRGYWDKNVHKEALKYSSRNEFKDGSPSAYRAAIRLGLLDKICLHMPKHVDTSGKNNPNFKWPLKRLQIEANKYITRGGLKKGSPVAYKVACERNLLDQICLHMPSASNKPYIDEELRLEALKYDKRSLFFEKSGGAYQVACRRGKKFLDKICCHMEDVYNYWPPEKLHPEALKYSDRTSFQRGSPGAWKASRKLGLLDKICDHMKILGGSSKPEKELFSIIFKKFPNTKKLRDKKVKIEGKPYIKGFEIDILVGNLGIEFDGKRYHSFEFMRKDKQKKFWSDEDIRNYHKLKDDWFAIKGIQILHIKEEDWNSDKESCIQKCLAFLKGDLCP